jgi:branched-chain amino acid transport system substrate-binding protein
VVIAFAGVAAKPSAAQPIRLGELNSYKVFPAFLEPYRKGMELAQAEINAAGGVLGRPLEIVFRDDNGTPGDAVRVAEELLAREKVVMLMGTFASNVGLAVADLAKQRKKLFLAAEPLTDKIVWDSGNRYTFRLRPSTFMQTAMLVPEAAKLGRKRWAIVYPNYEYGQSATAAFKKQMLFRQSGGLEFVEVAVPLGKIDAGPVAQALIDAEPDAIFSSLFGPDLARFVREGQLRGLFKDRPAGDDAEVHLGLANLRRRQRDAIVTGHRQFQATAERRAVDGHHDGLGALLDTREQVVQVHGG